MLFNVCPKCSHQNDPNASFCSECGVNLSVQQDISNQNTLPVDFANTYYQSNPNGQSYIQNPSIISGPSGLGGWLVLVCLGLFATIIQGIIAIIQEIPIITKGLDYKGIFKPGYISLLIFEVVSNILVVCFACYCLYLFFKKKKIFINLFVVFYVSAFTLSLIDLVIAKGMFPHVEISSAPLVQGLIKLAIWTWYIKVSIRAKNTFVA